jgi:hypothetical protein
MSGPKKMTSLISAAKWLTPTADAPLCSEIFSGRMESQTF